MYVIIASKHFGYVFEEQSQASAEVLGVVKTRSFEAFNKVFESVVDEVKGEMDPRDEINFCDYEVKELENGKYFGRFHINDQSIWRNVTVTLQEVKELD